MSRGRVHQLRHEAGSRTGLMLRFFPEKPMVSAQARVVLLYVRRGGSLAAVELGTVPPESLPVLFDGYGFADGLDFIFARRWRGRADGWLPMSPAWVGDLLGLPERRAAALCRAGEKVGLDGQP